MDKDDDSVYCIEEIEARIAGLMIGLSNASNRGAIANFTGENQLGSGDCESDREQAKADGKHGEHVCVCIALTHLHIQRSLVASL